MATFSTAADKIEEQTVIATDIADDELLAEMGGLNVHSYSRARHTKSLLKR